MEEQAIDRVHRLNQTVDVVVYRLTIAGTVEERIFELQEQKRALAEAAVEGKAVAKLSMKDILNLFKHDAENQWRDEKGVQGIGERRRVLGSPGVGAGNGGGESQAQGVRIGSQGSGVVRDEGRKKEGGRRLASGGSGGGEKKREHDVYGRRW